MLIHKNLPIFSFKNKQSFENWLKENHNQEIYHQKPRGVWLRFYKKNSNKQTITVQDAVDTALCWGWIDGLINRYDYESYLVKYTPRGKKSVWSQTNVRNIERLTKEGKMQPSGLIHVKAAKQDGRWMAAYASQSSIEPPKEFFDLLKTDSEAEKFFYTLTKNQRYKIAFQITTAVNLETQEKRIIKYFKYLQSHKKP